MATAYLLNRFLVFGPGDRGVPGEILAFALVNLLAVAQTLAISLLLAYYVLPALGVIQHSETLAHVVGVIVPVFTSFVGHKYWTFRNHGR
jgi:putative flippase GtrA